MSNTTNHSTTAIQNPGPWQIGDRSKMLLVFAVILGLAAIAGGFITGQGGRVWANVLLNYFMYFSLALGGLFFVALQYVTGAMWSVTVRRIAEGLSSFLPLAAVIGVVILVLGGHSLYEWMHLDVVQHDEILASKAGYLNTKFALIRTVGAFALWLILGRAIVKNSLAQDLTGDVGFTKRNLGLSAAFIPFFAICFSFLSFDYLMSLEPHWFSTMFGVYCFASLIYVTFCTITVIAILMRRAGVLPVFNENHLHDLGKFMYGFSVFWAYIGFSQFMLIWYANLPEETVYYLRRSEGLWLWLCYGLLAAKFIVPFFMLVPRACKRNETLMLRMAVFMLLANWLDYYIMVIPNFSPSGPVLSWIEIGVAAGFFGLFCLVITAFFAKVPAFAFRDPRIADSAAHHQ